MPGNAPNKKTRQSTSGRPRWVPFPGTWKPISSPWYQYVAPEEYAYEPSHDEEDEVEGLRSPQDLISEDRTQLPSYPGVDSEDGEGSEDDDFALVHAAVDAQSDERNEGADDKFEDIDHWGQQLDYEAVSEGDSDDENDTGAENNLDHEYNLESPAELKAAECDLLAAEDEALYDEFKVPQPRERPRHEWWKKFSYSNDHKKGKLERGSRRLLMENMLISSENDEQQQQQRPRGIATGVLNPGAFRAPPPGESRCHSI
ncbi:hypothetical protein ACRE_076880 [Hapsidospora chrysogenum ATCC 11550]|uniref:Uncharacterized protein n=1 Tax=Hapsidospora chrysogenum (strain ATCC 11550 / CBS 779.69 / DSM 880 / IAM 14645 / JCM 23072 / IMI 49137) TaxID=857340 RepID=A0A086SWW1_HAPC1|nr:hypothetical protein ACRE_076880 [Hapsidospora chrysogenum ATCC 11550]